MVIGEFGGLKPEGPDNPTKAEQNTVTPDSLFERVADKPPLTLQGYLSEQQSAATQANHLRDVLRNSPVQFAHDVVPFLDKEIELGNFAHANQNHPMRADLMMNFSSQTGWGVDAANMKNTLETVGAGALNDPGVRQGVDMYLQFIAGLFAGH